MKKLRRGAGLMICLLFVVSLVLAGCGGGGGEEALLGVWTDETETFEFEFKPDGVVLIRAMRRAGGQVQRRRRQALVSRPGHR